MLCAFSSTVCSPVQLFYIYVYKCFVCMDACTLRVCLVNAEVRGGCALGTLLCTFYPELLIDPEFYD